MFHLAHELPCHVHTKFSVEWEKREEFRLFFQYNLGAFHYMYISTIHSSISPKFKHSLLLQGPKKKGSYLKLNGAEHITYHQNDYI